MSQENKTILIIEDEKMIVEMYAAKLKEAGYQTLATDNAKEGLELTKSKKPDLVLLDIRLPEESGISYLKKLREQPDIAGTKVLVISNFDEPRTRKVASTLGVMDYLIKSDYTPKQMIKKIGEYL